MTRQGKQGDAGQARRRGEPAPLGSLTRPPDQPGPPPRTCSKCGTAAVTQLAMDLTDGTPVTFISCQQCEHRHWIGADGVELSVEDVLARSQRRT